MRSAANPLQQRLGKLAWVLDSAIPLPGGYSIGIDGLVGLIPGIGDGAAALVSTYIIAEGVRAGAPKSVLARMVGNVAVESAIGAIPIIGDLFDIVFKANVRNVALMDGYLQRPERDQSYQQMVCDWSRHRAGCSHCVQHLAVAIIFWLVTRAAVLNSHEQPVGITGK